MGILNMKTVTVTFVIENDRENSINYDIMEALDRSSLNAYPMYSWTTEKSTKQEVAWRKKYDSDR